MIEEDLKAGPPAGGRGHVLARARHRHGRRRPGDPGRVARLGRVQGMQRIGRAGHQVGAVSRGVLFPKYRGDLVQSAVVVERMRRGAIEAIRYPRNPLDVLAQQIVAMVAMDEWAVDDLEALVRRAAPFAELPRSALESVLDMLSGRYPSDEFAELRPRVTWDRVRRHPDRRGPARSASRSPAAGRSPTAACSACSWPGEKGTRVGELDEEMVYESRPGEVFVLGASSWRIEEITHDRVLVTPAPGPAREDAVLARRRARAPGRARPGPRRVRPGAGRRCPRRTAWPG